MNDVALYVFHLDPAESAHALAYASNSVSLSSSTHLLNRFTICGCFIAISGLRTTFLQALGLLGLGSFMSLLTSWAIASFAASQMPALSGPYLPSMIAILIGFSSNRLPKILKALTERVENKVGVKE